MLTTSIYLIIALPLAIAAAAIWLPEHTPGHTTTPAQPRPAIRPYANTSTGALIYSHDRPRRLPDLATAHLDMQRHRDCATIECGRKAAAFRVLVDAGRIKPQTKAAR